MEHECFSQRGGGGVQREAGGGSQGYTALAVLVGAHAISCLFLCSHSGLNCAAPPHLLVHHVVEAP
jgi:hypothetical protein